MMNKYEHKWKFSKYLVVEEVAKKLHMKYHQICLTHFSSLRLIDPIVTASLAFIYLHVLNYCGGGVISSQDSTNLSNPLTPFDTRVVLPGPVLTFQNNFKTLYFPEFPSFRFSQNAFNNTLNILDD